MMAVEMRANQAPYGWKGALYGSVSREIPWAASPFIKRMCVYKMHTEEDKSAISAFQYFACRITYSK